MGLDTQTKLAIYRHFAETGQRPSLQVVAKRVREWCAAHDYPMRPLVTMDQLWTLATTWYSTRLQENSRRPQPDEMRSIFAGLGLGGDFWDPQSVSFG